jgi:hypothetical protein
MSKMTFNGIRPKMRREKRCGYPGNDQLDGGFLMDFIRMVIGRTEPGKIKSQKRSRI